MASNPAVPGASILLATFHLPNDAQDQFSAWQSQALVRAAGADGFLNSEIAPGAAGDAAWTVTLRFRDSASLDSWRTSATWKKWLADAQRLVGKRGSIEVETRAAGADGSVVEVIVTRVKPDMVDEYREWETRVQQAQAKFPGYLGSYVQPPADGDLGWTTLMRFASAEQLNDWLQSKERAALLRDAEPLIEYAHLQRVDTSFPGWFPTDPGTGKGPPNWKAALLVLLGLFPIVMLETRFLSPQLAGLNSSLAMFIGNVISVALTTWATMPLFIKAFGWWLFPKPGPARNRAEAAGVASVLLLLAAEVAALWHLL